MNRTDILNYLIKKFSYKNYLEIGIQHGVNYKKVECKNKQGVDPNPLSLKNDPTINIMTSDQYFSSIDKDKKFDLIFIDGLHLDLQVCKDIENSLAHLSSNGTIVLHDCNPPTIYHAREDKNEITPAKNHWNGTTWKAFVKARCNKSGIFSCVVDTDWGCGIIRFSLKEKPFLKIPVDDCLKWEVFDKNRKEIMNLVSEKEFLSLNF